ncbi:MAG: SRPBCC family protein [Solirubrobacteraceae bacterium]
MSPSVVRETVTIMRPPEAVWELTSDPVKDIGWCPKVRSVQPVGDRRWRVIHRPVPLLPAKVLSLEHLEVQPPHRLSMHQEDDVSVFSVEYQLAATPQGTEFTQVSEFTFKRLSRVLRPIFKRGVRRDIQAQLRALKRLLESEDLRAG